MTRFNYLSGCLCLVLVLGFLALTANPGEEAAPDFSEQGALFLAQHCLGCHAGESPAAEVALDVYKDNQSLIENRDIWERVLDMVAVGQMPPPDADQPTLSESETFLAHIDSIFEYADRTAEADPGRITVRRLNRVEYKNTVRDLLGVDFDPTVNFPADDVGYGFDNIGDVLTVSPLLMERYLEAAEAIVDRVILVEPPPPPKRYKRGRDLEPRDDDAGYNDRYRLLDPTAEVASKTGPFTTDGTHLKFFGDIELYFQAGLYAETESEAPVKIALFVQGDALEAPSPIEELERLVGFDPAAHMNIKILEVFEITAREAKKPQYVKTLVSRLPNVERAGIAMLKPPADALPIKLQIRGFTSEGPLDTRPASQREILACTPDIPQIEQTREVLTRLLRRGYRRPPQTEEVEELTAFVGAVQAAGEPWEAAIQEAIKVILCSPKFLFRLELDDRPDRAEPYPIDPFHLASRLSYFLWSSMPDDELLDLAAREELDANLEPQIERMLADPKASELARNFGTQWLQIQRLATAAPDPGHFPTFTTRLKAAMLTETELFLESIFREDRSVLDLLDADYTFLNRTLANHYGIADTQGNWMGQSKTSPGGEEIKRREFQRVALQGTSRGGILTQASVLTVTSNPTRTSPVKRGRWVLEQLLGAPPPPPPPDVPELEEEGEAVHGTTLRERLEQHREDPACANCHAKMDPLGFALENYNAIGAFRQTDGELAIDATGELPDGTTFEGIGDLKAVLKDRKQEFARCLTEKLLTYALGRGLEYYDRPTVEHIVSRLETEGYRSSVMITAIVKSDPFRLKRGTESD